VWQRAGLEAGRNIDKPRIHFVACRKREALSVPAVCLAELGSSHHPRCPHPPRCRSLPVCSAVATAADPPRRLTLTTKRSVIRMAISVTVGFIVCFTPYFIVNSVRIYSDYRFTWAAAKTVSMLMALSHSAVNPFLYIIFSKRAVHAAFAHLCQRAERRGRDPIIAWRCSVVTNDPGLLQRTFYQRHRGDGMCLCQWCASGCHSMLSSHR